MDFSWPPRGPPETDPCDWSTVPDDFSDLLECDVSALFNDFDGGHHPSAPETRVDGVRSPGAASAETGQPASVSFGGDSLLPSAGAPHVAVEDELPPLHGSHVQMEGAQSLLGHEHCRTTDISTATVGAVPEPGWDDDGIRGPRALPVLPVGLLASSSSATVLCELLDIMAPERIDEPLLVRALHDAGDYWEKLLLSCIIDERKARGFFVDPQEPPTSKQSYITRFQGKNSIGGEGKEGSEEGGNEEEEERGRGRKRSEPPLGSGAGSGDKKADKKASYWKEKEVKAIRDLLSASGDILGLKRTLEYMKCGKRTRWLADEYVALKPCGEGAMQIRVWAQPTNHTKITQPLHANLA